MKKISRIKTIMLAAVACFGLVGAMALPTYADPAPSGVTCPSDFNYDNVTRTCKPVGGNVDLWKTIQTIINVILAVVGVIAVIMIIIGGIQYTTSAGDPGKVKKAKDTILYGIVGLVIALAAFAIVNFVLDNVFSK